MEFTRLDGFPLELFLELWDSIKPLLLNSINYALRTDSFHHDQNTSLKKGKSPLNCRNYRPISLIETELKFELSASKLIHFDQSGSLRGRLASDNVRSDKGS